MDEGLTSFSSASPSESSAEMPLHSEDHNQPTVKTIETRDISVQTTQDADSDADDNDVTHGVIIPMSDNSGDLVEDEEKPHDDSITDFSSDARDDATVDVGHDGDNDIEISVEVTPPNGDCQNQDDAGSLETESTLVFKDVCVSFEKKEVVSKVSGIAKLGEILAILGPVGAGKTTLLNALSGLVRPKSGYITLNGEPVTRQIRRKISYVQQTDVFYPHLTLKETLTFTALLRLPDDMPIEQKHRRIQEVVELLELKKCFNTKIGSAIVTGLSGGERKRASIACELLTNPRVLLLDEPTSGLDSALSLSLITNMMKFARDSNKTVVTTIHQPSSQIFHKFGNVLLMTEGEVAYFGPAKKIISFFADIGLHCTPHYNPADFILEQLKVSRETRDRVVQAAYDLRERDDWPEDLKDSRVIGVKAVGHSTTSRRLEKTKSTSGYENQADVDDQGFRNSVAYRAFGMDTAAGKASSGKASSVSKKLHQAPDLLDVHHDDAKWQTGFLTQYLVLTRRALLSNRSKYLSPSLIAQVVFISVFAGLEWFQSLREEETAKDRLGILFFVSMQLTLLPMMTSVYTVIDDVFRRERLAGIYRVSAYYLAITTAEIPTIFCLCTGFCAVIYWMAGLMPLATHFIYFWLLCLLVSFAAQGIGMTVGVLILDKSLAVIILQSFVIASLVAGGFYNEHLQFWMRWSKYLSFITYCLSAFCQIEFVYGSPLRCRPPNDTEFPQPCANSTWLPGKVFLDSTGLNFCPIYGNILVMVGILIVSRVGGYIALRYYRKPRV